MECNSWNVTNNDSTIIINIVDYNYYLYSNQKYIILNK